MRYGASKDGEKEEEEAERGGGHHLGFFSRAVPEVIPGERPC